MRKIHFYSFIASLLLLHTSATAQEIDPKHAAHLLYQAYQTSQGHPNHTDNNCYAYKQNEFCIPCISSQIIISLPEDQSDILTKLIGEINAGEDFDLATAQGIITDGLVNVTFHELHSEYRITSSAGGRSVKVKYKLLDTFNDHLIQSAPTDTEIGANLDRLAAHYEEVKKRRAERNH